MCIRTLIVTAGRREEGHRQTERSLSARCRAGERFPLPVLISFDGETMPAAIVQRPRQTFEERAALVPLSFGIDARL